MEKQLFDRDWKFISEDASGAIFRAFNKSGAWLSGAQSKDFDDSNWETIDLPHDYIIGKYPIPSKDKKETITDIPEMQAMDSMLTANGSLERNIAWYRKHFFVDESKIGRRIFIRFDGLFRNSEFYFNGFYLDRHLSGYTPITIELTDFIEYGKDNVISVKTDPRIPEGWWYEGGGIYRHVWLLETSSLSVKDEDVFVSSDYSLTEKSADIKIDVDVNNEENNPIDFLLSYKLFDCKGNKVTEYSDNNQMEAYSSKHIVKHIQLNNPDLWDIESPNLYKLELSVNNDTPISINFGIRTIEFDSEKGFKLNGRNIKIKGVCAHQDHAGLGAALFDGMNEYRLKKLKELGCNAFRTAHNPHAPEVLDICDRLGILVLDETRLLSSSPEDLRQIKTLIKRDRNHPSVFMYSIGNEEIHVQFKPCAERIVKTVKDTVYGLDGTRPITAALLLWDTKKDEILKDVSLLDTISQNIDILGINYTVENWDELHKHNPEKPFVITESATFPSTRGCIETEKKLCRLGLADKKRIKYGEGTKELKKVFENDYVAGSFIWTGFDFRGEPSPFGWPGISAQFGICDRCGFEKDAYYYYKAWWCDEPLVHICGNWNHKNGTVIPEIWCFGNCETVELLINGKSICKKEIPSYEVAIFENIPYEAGEIKAIGYNKGKVCCEHILKTSNAAVNITANVDFSCSSNDGREYAVVNIIAKDCNDITALTDESFLLLNTENCKIIGVGNGDPFSHTLEKGESLRLFGGLAQVILCKEKESAEALLYLDSPNLNGTIVKF